MSRKPRKSLLISLTLSLCSGLVFACPLAKSDDRLVVPTIEYAVQLAHDATLRKYPGFVFTLNDLQNAYLENGIWYVFSSALMPPGTRGGGRPEVSICAVTGEIIKMYFSR